MNEIVIPHDTNTISILTVRIRSLAQLIDPTVVHIFRLNLQFYLKKKNETEIMVGNKINLNLNKFLLKVLMNAAINY